MNLGFFSDKTNVQAICELLYIMIQQDMFVRPYALRSKQNLQNDFF